MIILIKEENTNPSWMEILWRTMVTCDKDYYRSKILLPNLKSFIIDIEACH